MKIKLSFFVLIVAMLLQVLSISCFAKVNIPFSISIMVKDLETEKKLNGLCFEIIEDQTSKTILPATIISNLPIIANLEPERIYTASISKEGYVKQILTISTLNLSKSKQLKGKYQIEIIGVLFERFEDEDYSAFEKSFGIIKFNLQSNDFIWNPNKSLQKKEEEIKSTRRRARKGNANSMVKQSKRTDYADKISQSNPKKADITSPKAEILADTGFVKSIETKKELVNNGEVLITNVVFQNGQTKEYRRIAYKWGGLFFKVNQADISEVAYNLTKTKYGF